MSLNVSAINCNQAMKFSQLMRYNVTNTFLEKSCRKRGK